MRPKERRETGDQDLFRSRPDQIIDLNHALVKLAGSRSIAPSPMPDIAATTRRPIVSASRHRSNAMFRRRAAIEPVIGHLKAEHRTGGRYC
jgi:hypothetical protein